MKLHSQQVDVIVFTVLTLTAFFVGIYALKEAGVFKPDLTMTQCTKTHSQEVCFHTLNP